MFDNIKIARKQKLQFLNHSEVSNIYKNVKTQRLEQVQLPIKPKKFSRTLKVARSLQKLPNMQTRISIYGMFFF